MCSELEQLVKTPAFYWQVCDFSAYKHALVLHAFQDNSVV